jgi:hypothetical protein
MCFEVVFQILCAVFAVFGIYSLIFFVSETWFGSDNIAVCIEVDTDEVAENMEKYLKEAFRKPCSRCGGVFVLIHRRYATESLLRKLRTKNVKYYVLNP